MKKILLFGWLLGVISTILSAQTESAGDFQKISELKYGRSQIPVGTIGVQYSEELSLKPDIAQFSITYLTEGYTPNNASNRNVQNMNELKKYLKSIKIEDKDITTLSYMNYQQTVYEVLDNKDKRFETEITIWIDAPKRSIYNVIELLEKHGINNFNKDDYDNGYYFTITDIASSATLSRKNAQNSLDKISQALEKSGVDEIDIKEYKTEQVRQDVKKYFVANTIRIKTSDFDNVGKVFAKAQELKMSVNNDLDYSVSTEQRQKAEKEVEERLFAKLQEKAKRTVERNGYFVGAPSHLNIQTLDYNNEYDYGYRGDMMANSKQLQDESQIANEIDVNPPSEYKITFVVNGSFDILQNIKK
ncbi:MAG: SIMPL domain-containing protein [Campylobacteraceae bacterium]|jgi:uncharacterized protein YggE|nr:SIMPL domain-containing protein [Campylobacteraceae bacterium]